jgi:molybdopterin-guanine dinucleotide biosynthesis protein A
MIDFIACVVLVGGESKRMGTDKASLVLDGTTLVERVIEVVRPIFKKVYIGAHEDSSSGEAYGLPVIVDTLPGRGPVLGVCAALEEAKEEWVFIVSCDLPMLSSKLIEFLATKTEGVDAVVPLIDGRAQTTCALYSRACLHPLSELVGSGEKGSRSLTRFLEETEGLRVRYVSEEELSKIDTDMESFADVDTPDDLEEAKERLRREE